MEHKLFFFLVGCTLPNRHTEQHDVFMGIGQTVKDCIPALRSFWPEAQDLHVDCWRQVTNVNGYRIQVYAKSSSAENDSGDTLFFINLGGYKKGIFDEFHHRELLAAATPGEAIRHVRKTPFYKQYGLPGATAHIDDRYGIDIDEIYSVAELLSKADRNQYKIVVTNELAEKEDSLHLGYFTMAKLVAASG